MGNPDIWELLCKESGKNWMKLAKRMNTEFGPIYQVSIEFRDDNRNVTACSETLFGFKM